MNLDEMVLCQGSKLVILDEQYPGVTIDSRSFLEAKNSSKSGPQLLRKLLQYLFTPQILGTKNRMMLERDHPDIMEALYCNFILNLIVILF